MQGFVTFHKYDAKRYTDEDFIYAKNEGSILKFLKRLELKGVYEGYNQILHGFVQTLFYQGGSSFIGAPEVSGQYYRGDNGSISIVYLSTESTAPVYTDSWSIGNTTNYDTATGAPFYSIGVSGSGKRFVEDTVLPPFTLLKDANGRQEAILSSLFLWYPGQGVSTSIRSFTVIGNYSDLDSIPTSVGYSALIARWRIRDSGGNPITLTKANTEVLLAQYDITFTTH